MLLNEDLTGLYDSYDPLHIDLKSQSKEISSIENKLDIPLSCFL